MVFNKAQQLHLFARMLNCPFGIRERYSISRVAGKYLLAYLDIRVSPLSHYVRRGSNIVIKCHASGIFKPLDDYRRLPNVTFTVEQIKVLGELCD